MQSQKMPNNPQKFPKKQKDLAKGPEKAKRLKARKSQIYVYVRVYQDIAKNGKKWYSIKVE